MPSTSLQVDRFLLAGVVVLTCALFAPQAADPVNVIKLAALTTCAFMLVVSAGYRILRYRVVLLPSGPAGWILGALILAFGISAAAAPVFSTAVVGAYGRNSGLLAYMSALVLFASALRVLPRPGTAPVLGALVVSGLFTATYGLLQRAGIDAIPWNNPFNPIIAALGNPNFASGYLGITATVALGGSVWHGWQRGWRLLSAATVLLSVLAASLSASVQGPIAAAGGFAVVILSLTLNANSRVRRIGMLSLIATAGSGLALLLVGALAKIGPTAAIFTDNGSRARIYYWDAALQMFADRPLLGVGLDQYGNFWRSTRSPGSVEFLGGPSFSDAAHSVPLQIVAQGGLVMAIAYAAFLGLVAVTLIRGLLQLQGQDRILLGAVGGGWVAYQVQSFVSIDQVPLIVLHFVLAGAVIAVAGFSRHREIRLPGAPAAAQASASDARTRRRLGTPVMRTRALSGADLTALSILTLLSLCAAWMATAPLRASVHLQNGEEELARGNGNLALDAYERAVDLTPGVTFYWNKIGALFDQVQQPARAREAYTTAVERDPYDVNSVKAAAARNETVGDFEQARRLYRAAVDLDPLNVDTLVPAATFELRHGGAQRARDLLEPVVLDVPADAALWATLGDARAVLGDDDAARQAYERALALDPAQETALSGLQKLRAPTT